MKTHRALTVLALRQGARAQGAGSLATELAGLVPWSLPALRRSGTRPS